MHYLDHADHSWPKPPSVYQALDRDVENLPPAQGERIITEAKLALAELLNLAGPSQLAFMTHPVEALKLVLQALPWQVGDGIVISALEPQALLTAVLHLARIRGVQVYIVPYSHEVPFDVAECEALLKTHPQIRLVAVSHASAVVGCVLPVAEIARLAKRYGKHCLVEASQTAGLLPLDMERDGIDWLVFSSAKSLQGPSGLAILCCGPSVCAVNESGASSIFPLLSRAERSPGQPVPQTLAALTEGIRWVQMMGLHTIQRHTAKLLTRLQNGLEEIPEVMIYGALEPPFQLPILSFNVLNYHPEVLGRRLFEEFGVWLQAGFHDSRLSHEAIGSIHRGGTLRVSLGYQTRPENVDALINALKAILVGSQGAWAL